MTDHETAYAAISPDRARRVGARLPDGTYPPLSQDPVARARREAARLLQALGDLDTADHLGLDEQRDQYLARAQAILDGLGVDLRAVADVLAPEPPSGPHPSDGQGWPVPGLEPSQWAMDEVSESELRLLDGNR